MSAAALLATLVPLLDGAGVPYMITGSFASTLHGEPRTTHDLDVVIDPSRAALTTLVAGLAAAAFYGMVAVAGATLDRTYLEPWLDALDLRATFAHATTA